jgi:hypothetical protein
VSYQSLAYSSDMVILRSPGKRRSRGRFVESRGDQRESCRSILRAKRCRSVVRGDPVLADQSEWCYLIDMTRASAQALRWLHVHQQKATIPSIVVSGGACMLPGFIPLACDASDRSSNRSPLRRCYRQVPYAVRHEQYRKLEGVSAQRYHFGVRATNATQTIVSETCTARARFDDHERFKAVGRHG